jgi:hypothetical protein
VALKETLDMKANVIHGDFNPCGDAERLSLVTIQALFEMGIDDIDLTTLTAFRAAFIHAFLLPLKYKSCVCYAIECFNLFTR